MISSILRAFALTLAAGLSTGIGSSIAFLSKKENRLFSISGRRRRPGGEEVEKEKRRKEKREKKRRREDGKKEKKQGTGSRK